MNKTSRCLTLFLTIGFMAFGDATEPLEYSDAEIKAKYAFISCLTHGDENGSHIRKALRMAGNDTNRFARVLRELAVENTNQTEYVLEDLGFFKTTQSLPFLYSYATNAQYGAAALKAVFAIEGVNSNSLDVAQSYFSMTNFFTLTSACDRSKLCQVLLRQVYSDPGLVDFRARVFDIAKNYNRFVNMTSPNCVDIELCASYPSYKFTKSRFAELCSYTNNICNYFNSLPITTESYGRRIHVFEFQTNYLQKAINELVAYPESALPD